MDALIPNSREKIKTQILADTETQELLGEVFASVYSEILNIVNSSVSASSTSKHKIIFGGINLNYNESDDLEIDVSGFTQKITPHGLAENKLIEKLSKKKMKIEVLKLKFQNLIRFAGDISEEMCEDLRILNDLLIAKSKPQNAIEYKNENSTCCELSTIVSTQIEKNLYSNIKNLKSQNGQLITIKYNNQSENAQSNGLSFGNIEIDINQETEQQKILRTDIEYHKLLLNYWRKVLLEVKVDENTKIQRYSKICEKGVPLYYSSDEFTLIGYHKDDVWYDCIYEEFNGTKIFGKFINGEIYGKGKKMLSEGDYFSGELFEDNTAVGKIVKPSQGIKIVSKFIIKSEQNQNIYLRTGYYKIFKFKKLTKEGEDNGEIFSGTIYENELYKTGTWKNNKPIKVVVHYSKEKKMEAEQKEENLWYYVKKNNDIIESYFYLDENNDYQKEYYSLENNKKTWKRYANGKLTWIKYIGKNVKSFEVNVVDNKFHGKGKYNCKEYSYEGDYENGDFNGNGVCIYKKSSQTQTGKFLNGRIVEGTLKIGDREYTGKFNNKGTIDGYGVLKGPGYKYEGHFKESRYNGKGKYDSEEYNYEGDYENGDFNGNGVCIFKKSSQTQTGKFLNGRIVEGTLKIGNREYTGKFNNKGTIDGYGVLKGPGFKYEGYFIESEYNGKGKYDSEEYNYDGDYVNGDFNGYGVCIFKKSSQTQTGKFLNGRIVEGTLKIGDREYTGKFNNKGTIDGYGVLKCPEYKYEGSFKESEFEGEGIKIVTNGPTYEGTFRNGSFVTGKQYRNNYIYTGGFLNGSRNGKGILVIDSNFKFEGNFVNGVPSSGVLIVNDRTRTGTFNSDFELEGQGVLVAPSFTYNGGFKSDQFNGHGTLRFSDGRTYEGSFSNGVITNGTAKISDVTFTGTFSDYKPLRGILSKNGSSFNYP